MRKRLHRRRWNQRNVSLFSFIDIIGGMIGALSLIIICVSLSHVVPESSSASPLYTQKRQTEYQIQERRTQIALLSDAVSKLVSQKNELQTVRIQQVNLQNNVDQMVDRQIYIAEALKEKQTLQKQISDLEIKRGRLEIDIAGYDKTADESKGSILRDRIEVHFTGRGKNLKPTFVECTANGLVIKNGEIKETINRRIISSSDKLHLLLECVKGEAGGTVVFLIRPDGIRSFNMALARTREHNVRAGKLPIPGSGEVDLSHYKEEYKNE